MAGISPWRVGQTDPPAHIKFIDDNGKPVSLAAGTTFILYIYNTRTSALFTGTGTFTNANLALGQVDYQWAAADVAIAGQYKVYAQYTLPTGSIGYGDDVDWTIKPLSGQ